MLTKNLIGRARAGDQSSVASVVDSLRPRLTKMAAYYGRETGEDPDDLLQEAAVGLLEALDKVDIRIGDPEQFLIKHARWRLLDSVKRLRRRRCDTLDESHAEWLPSGDWHMGLSEVWVDDFARHLAPTQRAVLDHLLVGRTWREAGDYLGCSSANVAYHVRQIRRTYERWSSSPVSAAAK
ncbi:MAG: RNA polymerase sigma factor [Capsulimonadaceae bacterium]